jgi:hypothetical protein
MVKLICLANSWKHGDRCVAGINPETGEWIRPISEQDDGRISSELRLIEGEEPQLLDILEIPLAETSWLNHLPENRDLLPGAWQRVGLVSPSQLLPFIRSSVTVLHNDKAYITTDELQALPTSQRQSLQLICGKDLTFQDSPRPEGGLKWKISFTTLAGERLTNITITDPVLVKRLIYYQPRNPCLMTMSLSMPFCPHEGWKKGQACWKLMAGMVELSTLDTVLIELLRVGWSIEQGRNYLQQHYGKRSRYQLTPDELQTFLVELRQIPTPQLLTKSDRSKLRI